MFDVKIAQRPALRVSGVRHVGPYMELGPVFQDVAQQISDQNFWPNTRGMVGVYYDNPDLTPAEELRAFAGVTLAEDAPAADGMQELTLDGGEYGQLEFTGPYTDLPKAYAYIGGEWLPNSGREHAEAPSYEVYLNDPTEVPPEELKTLICFPLN